MTANSLHRRLRRLERSAGAFTMEQLAAAFRRYDDTGELPENQAMATIVRDFRAASAAIEVVMKGLTDEEYEAMNAAAEVAE